MIVLRHSFSGSYRCEIKGRPQQVGRGFCNPDAPESPLVVGCDHCGLSSLVPEISPIAEQNVKQDTLPVLTLVAPHWHEMQDRCQWWGCKAFLVLSYAF